MKSLAFGTLFGLFLSIPPLYGCGGWDEQEPPTLDAYLDRLPAKSVGRIFFETAPAEQYAPPPKVMNSLRAMEAKVKTTPPEKLLAELDALIAAARSARAQAQAPSAERPLLPVRDLNLLHDARDAIASSGAEAADYLAWRLDNDATIQPEPQLDPYNGFSRTLPPAPKTVLTELEKRAGAAQGPIRAQWLYLRGAVAFHYGDKANAQTWFEKVLTEFPDHPRAETALLMKGRCLLSASRAPGYDFDERTKDGSLRDAAQAAFDAYLKKYPEGRFASDAKGWLGGLAWDAEDYLGSLEWYIRQAETPDHPEVLKSAVLMIEKTLRRLAATEDEEKRKAAFALVAAHPRVAMGMLYLVLGSPDAAFRFQYPDDRETPSILTDKIRKWRQTLLPELAAAVAAQQPAYQSEAWHPRYLALLVHAASNGGKHEEALRIAALDPQPEASEDLCFAKAVALQRAGKTAEDIAQYRLLLKKFPGHYPPGVPAAIRERGGHYYNPHQENPLGDAARIRLAIALRDNHQAGLALLELKALQVEQGEKTYEEPFRFLADYTFAFTDSGVYPSLSNAEPEQIAQLTDTLRHFAPLPELAAAAEKTDDQAFAWDLRALIAKRALAREDFQTARQMMSAAQYGLGAAELERLTADAHQPKLKPAEQAQRELRVGDAWAARRNLLAHSGDAKRRTNALTLGFKNPDDEMEQSDERIHAWRWWLKAARTAPGTPIAAAARLKVLQTMADLARGSDYFLLRATEDGWGAASRQIYDRLQAESPRSEEAKQAAWWSFALPTKEDFSREGRLGFAYDGSSDNPGLAGYWWSDYGVLGGSIQQDEVSEAWNSVIIPRLNALRTASFDVSRLAGEVTELKRKAEESYNEITEAACLNALEDLALLLAEPGITQDTAHAYINLRLDVMERCSWWNNHRPPVGDARTSFPEGNEADGVVRERIAKALKNPQFKSVRDYVEFLDIAMVANHQIRPPENPGEGFDKAAFFQRPLRDYVAVERMAREFLKRYPQSHKREAARLMLARAVYRQSWPRYQSDHPSANTSGAAELCYQQEPFNPKRVLAPLDEYDREFPKGRYAADIRNLRAGVLWRTAEWSSSLKLTLAQKEEDTPGLRVDTAFRLAGLFAELANPEHRPAMMAAIRENPGALDLLKEYLAEAPNYRDHPLRFLGGYLQDRLSSPVEKKQRE